jgi:trehalose 6-phosphate phosphatase
VLVLLDYDGTLVPIVDRPTHALLSNETRAKLAALREVPGVQVGVVSGRSLEDVASKVLLDGLWYVGNHGFEIRSPDGEWTRFFEPEETKRLAVVRDEIERATASIPGVLLEPKGPTLAVHFRQVAPERAPDVERVFFQVMGRHYGGLRIGYGKAVLEARLRAPCNKGSAVRFIRGRAPKGALTLYFGDDRTDQYAFRELWGSGVSVGVGSPPPALADYLLPDPDAVVECLGLLRQARLGQEAS